MSDPRYTRQARLAEVGEGGQARLRGAEAALPGEGTTGAVAARYGAGAGFRALRVRCAQAAAAAGAVDARIHVAEDPGLTPSALPAWLDLRDPAAREVAQGAYDALVAIRAALGAS